MNGLHLDDFTLAALALGDLPPALGADARQHLHGCGDCAGRFQQACREADALGDPGAQALSDAGAIDAAGAGEIDAARPSPAPFSLAAAADAPHPVPTKLREVARPDGGAVLLFPARAQGGPAAKDPAGLSRLAGRVFGRFEQLLHAAAGVTERSGDLEVAAGESVHTLRGKPGETLDVWFGNPHPHATWLTVLRQDASESKAPVVCDGPRALDAGRNASDPTSLKVEAGGGTVLAILTKDAPPVRERLDEALAMGLFDVFDRHQPVGQVLCKIEPN